MEFMNSSPVHFRQPTSPTEDGKSWACATIRFVHGPSGMDTSSHHVAMQGSIDDPEIQAKLRKELADAIYNAIVNDEWGAPRKSHEQLEEEIAEMLKKT